MPRRHRRDDEPTPLNITPADIPRPRRRTRVETEEEREERLDRAAEYRRKRDQAARRKRVQEAINWDVCLVPGCLERITVSIYDRDVDTHLPICNFHAVIVKQQLEPYWAADDVIEERRTVQAHKDQVRAAHERAATIAINGNSAQGQIYFLRANGLIKVGWSSDLTKRLKAYGPEVEILCHYPGSRQDETLMHRQLRPYLAKGREWYQDCKLIGDVVARLVSEHGKPHLSASWTEPKADPIKRRRSA